MAHISPTDMITAGPLLELLEREEADLAEITELAPDSSARIEKARRVKRLREAIEKAHQAAPTCGSAEAARILGVTERQATKLARSGRVTGWQGALRGPWSFDVRSCHAYAARKGRAA